MGRRREITKRSPTGMISNAKHFFLVKVTKYFFLAAILFFLTRIFFLAAWKKFFCQEIKTITKTYSIAAIKNSFVTTSQKNFWALKNISMRDKIFTQKDWPYFLVHVIKERRGFWKMWPTSGQPASKGGRKKRIRNVSQVMISTVNDEPHRCLTPNSS